MSNYDLVVRSNYTDFAETFEFYADGELMNIDDWAIYCEVRDLQGNLIVTPEIYKGVGLIVLKVPSETMRLVKPGIYRYDIKRVENDFSTVLFGGRFIVNEGVTRTP
ncbi:MAG TPA: hypothetical protein PLU67_07940 [Candidatus Kapabacteria bacterium]|nr:hypothetical protein [Candidatus Kapabacteria bacterium]HOM05407.1 hypothetical protein [Candidatus Kapabacteria bacterium]HPP39474.1 hypothetical protein [Candidatus Kapabacteria bacterium]